MGESITEYKPEWHVWVNIGTFELEHCGLNPEFCSSGGLKRTVLLIRRQAYITRAAAACVGAERWTCMLVKSLCSGLLLPTLLWILTCTAPLTCAHVCTLIALVTQAVSHSHRSKLWVGEGHCGADRGDGGGDRRGGGRGWVEEKETEGDDNEKLKAAKEMRCRFWAPGAAVLCCG